MKTLLPVIDRLKQRLHIASICIVADRGMIAARTIGELQAAHRLARYILGARLRAVKEIYEQVLSRPGRYREVYGPKQTSKDPSPLKVKEVRVAKRRYVVCHNADQAKKDVADREAIVAGKAIQAAGVALGPAVRLLDDGPPLPPVEEHPRSANDIPC